MNPEQLKFKKNFSNQQSTINNQSLN
ncbi:hypothetical protein LYNGBM3L_10780 [Moorena producens 3L]|uniref:Uncharacterized protein n=1 Tax=Moorena producens 3L TaxID=489825 RepID=F4XJZ5_9CYAN|nr:hypothetical protein LYNGBM3L_10780 [Moorena producens 3L]